ncbi:helix-turn-helix domain-containing protein [Ancylobacter mangrovi]|uniref:Helix-turn-helix domain-containing protein n=1 Tax=Ancylobacter mangrovi TaxID=2972472 RepID=A0A9X2T179_9HYPH|nr:helix-turn-helix domain-containing protein [Ancylobacter mangrovi]MCS0494720.1 helix-turn-helix domain-containing protein [Ancylobacter mangrovi]MCS0502117.1 helix-turn-helix domain-containing protein [Ancylobacter mangrovi]
MDDTALPANLALAPSQCRAARAVLNWSLEDLAARAHVTADWLEAFEQGRERAGDADPGEAERLRRAFEEADIDFLEAGEASSGGGPGLRMRQKAGYIPAERLSSANDV